MSPERVAFYSTAATVIPVLGLGSVVGIASLARAASSRLDAVGATVHSGLLKLLETELEGLQSTRLGKAVVAIELYFLKRVFLGIGRRFVWPLLFFAFFLPTVGEVSALAALAHARTGHETVAAVWIGLGVSGFIALAPILQTLLFLTAPFAVVRKALREPEPPESTSHA